MSSLSNLDTSASVYQPAQLLNWVYLTLADQQNVGGPPTHTHGHINNLNHAINGQSPAGYANDLWTPGSHGQPPGSAGTTLNNVNNLLKNQNLLTESWTNSSPLGNLSSNPFQTSNSQALNSPFGSIQDLADHFSDLSLSIDRKPGKRPPSSYLCHLCFNKGHYIKDCPQVGY
nr:hypothetical protein BaRGS_003273 [Batillaria attramentaria]